MKRIKYFALAALVAFGACSDSGTTTQVTGTINGTVTIAGAGAAGITVTLSSGSTATTDGSGGYSFTNVPAGAYTITISDYPADVTFSSTSKAATISAASATVTVSFSGTYIMTSSISGSVTAAGTGLAGVAVALSGTAAKSGVTDASGNYAFNGLRAGDYTVTISNIPAGYTFATTSASVSVGVGEAKSAPFVGQAEASEVSANVVIKSVTNNLGQNVNPGAITGQINVTLAIDPGNNILTDVCVQLDGADVANGCQTLGSGAPGLDGPQAATVLEPTFSINTADAPGGTPTYANGAHTLSARLGLSGAKQSSVQTSMQLTFVNADMINIDAVASVPGVIGGDGLAWNGGSLTITGTPVMFSGGTIASMTLCANQQSATGTPAMGTTSCKSATASPFTVTIPRTSTSGSNLTGWSSADVRITAASVTTGGSNGPSVTVGSASSMRVDEVAPTYIVALPTSVMNNYLGKAFQFKSTTSTTNPHASATVNTLSDDPDGAGAATDAASNITVTYYVGDATVYTSGGATEDAKVVAENPAVTDVLGLASTITNTAYVVVVKAVDVTGNATITRLGGGVGTPVGVDVEDPVASLDAASTANGAINPNPTDMTIQMTDVYSGFGATPVDVQVIRYTVNSTTGATVTRCIDPVNAVVGDGDDVATTVPTSTGVCAFVSQAGSDVGFDAALTNDAYYDVTMKAHDRAGNESTTSMRSVLLDDVNPGVTVSGITAGANLATVAGTVTDDLDLAWWDTRLTFSGGPAPTLPFSTPTTVSAFGTPYAITASASGSAPLIRGYQDQIPSGGTWNLTGAGFGAADVAGNFNAANFSTASAFVGLGGTVSAAAVTSSADLCLSGKTTATWCGATTPTSPATVTLSFTATTGNNDNNPFTNGVWFYVEDLGGVDYVLGQSNSPSLQTGTTTRTWTWTMTLAATQVPMNVTAPASGVPATLQIRAMAVESDYDGLHVPFTLTTR